MVHRVVSISNNTQGLCQQTGRYSLLLSLPIDETAAHMAEGIFQSGKIFLICSDIRVV